MTKPLIISGKLVSTLKMVFKHGEVALVSIDSPIKKTGIHLKNTLFDENAASHLAFGQA